VAQLLVPGAAANTAAATGAWVDISAYDGFIAFVQQVGVVTGGSITGKIQHADDGSGTNVADVTGGGFTAVTTANDPASQKIVIPTNALKPFVRYLGTIATGPADVGVVAIATKQYV
jgi:hypothetical protein